MLNRRNTTNVLDFHGYGFSVHDLPAGRFLDKPALFLARELPWVAVRGARVTIVQQEGG
jgi:hypothetical protein